MRRAEPGGDKPEGRQTDTRFPWYRPSNPWDLYRKQPAKGEDFAVAITMSSEPSSPRRRELVNSDSEGDSASSSEDEPLFKFPDRGGE